MTSEKKSKSKKSKSKSKYLFTLKNIDVMRINAKYGINSSCNIPCMSHIHPDNTTDLSSLRETTHLKNREPEKISFLDESKRLRSCTLCSVDFKDGHRWCWWCQHPFDSAPWGCPLRIDGVIGTRTYISSISKTKYTLREKKASNSDNECSYITDGMFCSVNCCAAWAKAHKKDPTYMQTPFLLHKMYNQVKGLTGKKCARLPPAAPDWRLLERFGGYLSIHQFREDFDKITYNPLGTTKTKVAFKPIAHCFEEKLKF